MPWPPRSSELRRVEWEDYQRDPAVGLIVDPRTGEPYGDVIVVRLEVTGSPPRSLEVFEVGDVLELPLRDFLTMESQRADLGQASWAQLIDYVVKRKPPSLQTQLEPTGLPRDFDRVREFLFEILAEGPVPEVQVIAKAGERGIPTDLLREVKDRLRIASVTDDSAQLPQVLWRLRMSQAYLLRQKKRDRT